MIKKLLIIVLIVILLSSALLIYYFFFSTHGIEFYDIEPSTVFSDSYWRMTAVISNDGNCYIRGGDVTRENPYGIKDTIGYNNVFNSLDYDKSDKYIKIYAKGDAKSVELSDNGGVIVTNKNQLYLFTGNKKYKTPTYFCDNVSYAKLIGDKIYMLSPTGDFGYRDINSPSEFILLKNDISKFLVNNTQSSLWVLTVNNELLAYASISTTDSPLISIPDVADFDVSCDYYKNIDEPFYTLAYVSVSGKAYFYRTFGLPQKEQIESITTDENIEKISLYSNGAIMLTKDKRVVMYTNDFSEYYELVWLNLENVSSFSVDLNISFIIDGKGMIFCGATPSSANYHNLSDFVIPNQE